MHKLFLFIVVFWGLWGGAGEAAAQAGLAGWPVAPDMRTPAQDNLWDVCALRGPVKFVRVDAYLGEVLPDGSVVKAQPEQRIVCPPELRHSSLWGAYPLYGAKGVPAEERYDRQGRLLERREFAPDGRLASVLLAEYSAAGRLSREIVHYPLPEAERVEVAYAYDESGRLRSIVRAPYSELYLPIWYVYDAQGRLSAVMSQCARNVFIPEDARSHPEVGWAREKITCSLRFAYDSRNRVVGRTLVDEYGTLALKYAYARGGVWRLARAEPEPRWGRFVPDYAGYDGQGRTQIAAVHYAFAAGDVNRFTTVYARDRQGRVVGDYQRASNTGQPGEWLTSRKYYFDPAGNMILLTDCRTDYPQNRVSFSYDARGNWIQAAHTDIWVERETPQPVTPAVLERIIEYWD